MDAKNYVKRLLEDLEHVAGPDERGVHDPDWLRGYVAGIAVAAQYALELDEAEDE
ncbi:hypothetical protein [Candidatus Collinsella stercoripullorum]|uniref:hypothetical protein n=1 Tax=Candidatus Collinsella stercoripullorum TaxID=2838522 RepID=UPI0022E36B61|nr:hypothetical protein [Candidatus Collinsella stercoripullorum]